MCMISQIELKRFRIFKRELKMQFGMKCDLLHNGEVVIHADCLFSGDRFRTLQQAIDRFASDMPEEIK